jgi:hypothetical protein
MEFLTLGFWWWAIRVLMPMLSLMTLAFAISPMLTVDYVNPLLNGYHIGPTWKEIESKRGELLLSKSRFDRGFYRLIFAMADNRLLTAWASSVIVLTPLLW